MTWDSLVVTLSVGLLVVWDSMCLLFRSTTHNRITWSYLISIDISLNACKDSMTYHINRVFCSNDCNDGEIHNEKHPRAHASRSNPFPPMSTLMTVHSRRSNTAIYTQALNSDRNRDALEPCRLETEREREREQLYAFMTFSHRRTHMYTYIFVGSTITTHRNIEIARSCGSIFPCT